VGFTQCPIQWQRGAISLGVKRPGREFNNQFFHLEARSEYTELHFFFHIYLNGVDRENRRQHCF
jgi:hypothetical protein